MSRPTTHDPRATPLWLAAAGVAVLALAMAATPALAQVRSSANYAITADGIDSGGGTSNSANYTQRFSFAQAFESPPMVGVNYNSQGGLLATTSPDTQAPGVPANLIASAASTTQINLSWSPSTDNVAVTGYQVFRGGIFVTTAASPGYLDSGLTPSTPYSYTVAACDAAGNCSAQSASASATTQALPDTSPPTVPTGLAASAVSSSQINLNWTASSDNVLVTAYQVFRDGAFRATVSGSTSFSDTGLSGSTLYSYTVTACDASGNCSAQSTPASATTLAATTSFAPLLRRGWNLIGNSLELTLSAAAVFGTPSAPVTDVTTHVNSIWKWNATLGLWQFYAPSLTAQENLDYADINGFEVLAAIEPGMGYWVNIKNTAPTGGVTLPVQSGTPVVYEAADLIGGAPAKIAGRNLVTGWQLVALADGVTPSQFNENLSGTPPQAGVVKLSFQSLWAWDAVLGTWYFYAPSLEQQGVAANQGLALVQQYALDNGFLHFEDYGKTLGVGTGFWMRK